MSTADLTSYHKHAAAAEGAIVDAVLAMLSEFPHEIADAYNEGRAGEWPARVVVRFAGSRQPLRVRVQPDGTVTVQAGGELVDLREHVAKLLGIPLAVLDAAARQEAAQSPEAAAAVAALRGEVTDG